MKINLMTLASAAALCAAAASGLRAQDLPGGLVPDTKTNPTRQGTRGANFLELGVGARGQAMAGAVASLVDGPTAMYWNPAGIASGEKFSIAASRMNLYTDLDISHNFVGVTIPVFGGVVGAHFLSLNSGPINRTTTDNPEGGDLVAGSTFEWNSTSIGVSYGRRLTDRLDLGGTLKYVGEGLTDAKTSWGALDVGTQFRTGLYGLTIGAAVLNIGPSSQAGGAAIRRRLRSTDVSGNERTDFNLTTQETELPTLFRFSVGSDLIGRANSLLGQKFGAKNSLNGELAVSDAIDTNIQFAVGLEYSFANTLFLRGGERAYNDQRNTGSNYGLSGGFGLRLPVADRAMRFDYGYTQLGELKNLQVFSFEFGR
ncbi:MAG TPA: PorV/PorQ family protein [Gemmatimonadaceae bacterium]|nr:PorV/PorQ family protein [Gemmatimonadaceae bacterium]